jgi:hypothetical protein
MKDRAAYHAKAVKWLASIAALSLTLAGPAARGSQRVQFAAGGRAAVEIPFVDDDGHVFLEGRINGVGPVWMTLDTGAAGAVVDAARAAEFAIAGSGRSRATGAGGTENVQTASGIEFAIDGRPVADIAALRRLLRQDGRQLAVTVRREGRTITRMLKLRRLV